LPKHALVVYEGLWDNPIIEARQAAKSLNIPYKDQIVLIRNFGSCAHFGAMAYFSRINKYRLQLFCFKRYSVNIPAIPPPIINTSAWILRLRGSNCRDLSFDCQLDAINFSLADKRINLG